MEGWRDPFVVTTLQSGTTFRMLLGSGYHRDGQKNGCVLQYSAADLMGPWRYDGVVAEGDCKHGRVWECPALVQVTCELSCCIRVVLPLRNVCLICGTWHVIYVLWTVRVMMCVPAVCRGVVFLCMSSFHMEEVKRILTMPPSSFRSNVTTFVLLLPR